MISSSILVFRFWVNLRSNLDDNNPSYHLSVITNRIESRLQQQMWL